MRSVTVGVDGSKGSIRALEWAAHTIGTTGRIHAVHAVPADHTPPFDAASRLRGWCAPAHALGTAMHHHVVRCDVVDALIGTALSEKCDTIIVGGHPRAAFATTLSHTTARLLRATDVPTIVVPHDGAELLRADSTIVVGVGHGAATRAALRWAAALAVERATKLCLVHALAHRPVFRDDGALDVLAYYVDPSMLHTWAMEDLAELAEEVQRSAFSPIAVSWRAASGRPGPQLVRAATDAALLVVGRHVGAGSEHFTVPSLHHVLRAAPCPVALIPTDHGVAR
jgi:nucleotide-binding universal stress UspA family protein